MFFLQSGGVILIIMPFQVPFSFFKTFLLYDKSCPLIFPSIENRGSPERGRRTWSSEDRDQAGQGGWRGARGAGGGQRGQMERDCQGAIQAFDGPTGGLL